MRLTLVIPTLNEEQGIQATLDALPRDRFPEVDIELDVLVVDGESTDGTVAEAKKRGARVVTEPRRGYGRAYKTGFDEAQGDLIATMDADGTYPAEDLPGLVARVLDDDLDFLTTDRFAAQEAGAMGAKHRFGNWVLSATMRALFDVDLHDSQSGMWVFRRGILPEHLPEADGMPFSEEIKIRCFTDPALRCAEVPIRYAVRTGEAKIRSFHDGWENFRHLFRLRRRLKQERRAGR